MNRNDLPNILFKNIHRVEPYPDLVAPVTTMLDKTAFFPGGKGLWLETITDVFPSILVLGQDFSTLDEYMKMLSGKKNDLDCPTWKGIIKLFNEVNISLSECFFSNVFMGLRKTKSMVGKFPGFEDKEFVKRNVDFLNLQIEQIKPKFIITLGIFAPVLLGMLAPKELVDWKTAKKFNDIIEPIKFNVEFGNHECACIALVHPSMRDRNVKHRKYNGYIGNDAEIQMLKDVLKI